MLSLDGNLTLNSISYNDGKRFLGLNISAKNIYTDVWWDDKRIKVNHVDNVRIISPIPRNSLRLYAKSEFRFTQNVFLAGPSTTIKLDKLDFDASYLYNFQDGKFEPVVGVKFNPFR